MSLPVLLILKVPVVAILSCCILLGSIPCKMELDSEIFLHFRIVNRLITEGVNDHHIHLLLLAPFPTKASSPWSCHFLNEPVFEMSL